MAIGLGALGGCQDPAGSVCGPDIIRSGNSRETRLGITLLFADPRSAIHPDDTTGVGWLRVGAVLQPGLFDQGPRDRCGNPVEVRPVLNDTLLVRGVPVVPPTSQGANYYSADWTVAGSDFTAMPVEIIPPTVAGVSPDVPVFRMAALGRVGSDSIALGPDEDLHLVIAGPVGTPAPATVAPRWTLQLMGDTTSLQISGLGFPPDTISVARGLFPPADRGELRARLSSSQQAFDQRYSVPGIYAVDLTLDVQLWWVVTLTP